MPQTNLKTNFFKKHIVFFSALIIGIVLIILPFIFTKEQCSDGYISSNCVVGADIGAGMLFIYGILVIIMAFIGLIGSIIIKKLGKEKAFTGGRILKIIVISIVALYLLATIITLITEGN